MQICVHWPDYTCRSAPLFSPASAGAGRAIDLWQFIGLIDVSCIRSAYPGPEWPRCPFLSTSWYVGTPIRRTRLPERLCLAEKYANEVLCPIPVALFSLTGQQERQEGVPHPVPDPRKCPVTQIRAFVGPRRSGEQDTRTWHSYACAAHAPFLAPPLATSLAPSLSPHLDASLRLFSACWVCRAAFRVFALPLLVSRSIRPPGRIVAPEGPRIPAGCVCYPASCLRTRVVKKILATGGWLEEGIMREWACAAFVDIFFGWLITQLNLTDRGLIIRYISSQQIYFSSSCFALFNNFSYFIFIRSYI